MVEITVIMQRSNSLNKVYKNFRLMPGAARLNLFQLMQQEMCGECGSMNLKKDFETGEIACGDCGIVKSENDGHLKASFDESVQSSPSCELSFSRSLGNTTSQQALFKVLTDTMPMKFDPVKKQFIQDKDLTPEMTKEFIEFLNKNRGLRARYIRIFETSAEPGPIKKCLAFGEEMCQTLNLLGEDTVEFRKVFGRILRNVASLALFQKSTTETFEARKLAVATFVYVWQLVESQHGMRSKIRYQSTFPSSRTRYRRGLKSISLGCYKVSKTAWDFVLISRNVKAPAHVLSALKYNGQRRLRTPLDLRELSSKTSTMSVVAHVRTLPSQ